MIRNESAKPIKLQVHIEAGADFADLFEVKDAQPKKGQLYQSVHDGRLTLGYRRGTFVRETFITSTAPAHVDRDGLSFEVHIEPHGEWSTRIDVDISVGALPTAVSHDAVGRLIASYTVSSFWPAAFVDDAMLPFAS